MRKRLVRVAVVTFTVPLALFGLWFGVDAFERRREDARSDLFAACQTGDVHGLSAMLDAGADPNTRQLPESSASLWDRVVAVFGGQPIEGPRRPHGVGLLEVGAGGRHPYAVIKTLLDHGARLDAAPGDPADVLCAAAGVGDAQAIGLLLDRGVPIEATDSFGMTPLAYGVLANRPSMVRLVLDRAAKPNGTIGLGARSYLAVAKADHAGEIVRLLKQYGAK
jgi:ankyrin repeat protein